MPQTAVTVEELAGRYRAQIAERAPASLALNDRALRVLAGGVSSHAKTWHPFYVSDARGSKLVDLDGNEYVDLLLGYGPNLLGHSPTLVVEAVRGVLEHGTALGVATPLEVELAEAIARLVPGMESMRFVVTGTEATMMALRVARAYTGRTRIGKFEGHYHGQHDGVLMSGVGHAVAGPIHAPQPALDCAGLPPNVADNVLMLPWNDPEAAAALIRSHAHELAAVICEPVPFFMLGGTPPLPGVLEALRDVTRERDVMLIFDEVVTGFRLAPGGATEYFGVRLDLHTFGKLAGGGFPIGVYGGRREIMEATVAPDPQAGLTGRIFQSGTFSGSPVSMAAGIAILSEVERGEALETAAKQAGAIREAWRDSCEAIGLPAQVTGISSWLGLYFTDRPIVTRRDTLASDQAKDRAFALGLLAGGVYLAPAHPGFTSSAHTDDDVALVVEVSDRVLSEIGAAS